MENLREKPFTKVYGDIVKSAVDTKDATKTYYGYAKSNTKDTDSFWAIQRVVTSPTLEVLWANGSVDLLLKWSDRETLSYS